MKDVYRYYLGFCALLIHPAHVPLVIKAHAAHINRLGNIRP